MSSRWSSLKPAAIVMRQRGNSLRSIEAALGVPRSTLSLWCHNITLTSKQQNKLLGNQRSALAINRERMAALSRQRELQLVSEARQKIDSLFKSSLFSFDTAAIVIAFLIKNRKAHTTINSCNPLDLRLFLHVLQQLTGITPSDCVYKLKIGVGYRPEIERKYWSESLQIPHEKFLYVSYDCRTRYRSLSSRSSSCTITVQDVAFQIKMAYLKKLFTDYMLTEMKSRISGD